MMEPSGCLWRIPWALTASTICFPHETFVSRSSCAGLSPGGPSIGRIHRRTLASENVSNLR